MTADQRLKLRVSAVRCEARDVLLIELRDPAGAQLPPFTAGAHLEITLAPQLVRHYSLCSDPAERDRYWLGIGLARDSRGGSKRIHDTVRVGSSLTVGLPRNNFPLDGSNDLAVFIAGGIGITPVMAMIRACAASGRPWRLYYCTRNRQRTAFYEDLRALPPERIHFHFDDEQPALFDAAARLAEVPAAGHIYCCGPAPLMNAVQAATAGRDPERVHFEWFTAAEVDNSADQPFEILLRNRGKRLNVPAGRSILEVLEDAGEGVPYSCREGLCATCRTPVLAGIPDHRDSVLSAAERAANDQVLICVSRAKTAVLELDL